MAVEIINRIAREKVIIEGEGSKKSDRKESLERLFDKESKAQSFLTWLEARYRLSIANNDTETSIILRSIINKYKYFETNGISYPEQWQGKSELQLIKKPDKIIAIKYKKQDKDSKPKEIKTEISKEQLNCVITALNQFRDIQPIKTKYIAKHYSEHFKLGHKTWDDFFSDRNTHYFLTIILDVLDKEGLIHYSGGKSKILKNKLDIQMVLE